MGVCVSSKMERKFTNSTCNSTRFEQDFTEDCVQCYVGESKQLIVFHYIMHFDYFRQSQKKNIEFFEEVNSKIKNLLQFNATTLLACETCGMAELFDEVFKSIDSMEELKDFVININLIVMMKNQIINANIGTMKCLVFSTSNTGKLVITELGQPHIYGRADETKRIIKNSLKNTSTPNLNYNNKETLSIKAMNENHKVKSNSERFWQVSRCLGLTEPKRRLLGLTSNPEISIIPFSSEIITIGIFSSGILRVMNSFEIALFMSQHLKKKNDAAKISKSLADNARTLWKTSKANISRHSDETPPITNSLIKLAKLPQGKRDCFCSVIII